MDIKALKKQLNLSDMRWYERLWLSVTTWVEIHSKIVWHKITSKKEE